MREKEENKKTSWLLWRYVTCWRGPRALCHWRSPNCRLGRPPDQLCHSNRTDQLRHLSTIRYVWASSKVWLKSGWRARTARERHAASAKRQPKTPAVGTRGRAGLRGSGSICVLGPG